MDECGVKINTGQSAYGHSQRGVRCVEIGRYIAGSNYTFNFIVGLNASMFASVIPGPSNANQFVIFFTEATEAFTVDGEPLLTPGDTVVVDNAPIHHHEAERLLFNLLDDFDIELVYLPNYSPDFNPAENCFNKLKITLKRDYYRELLHENFPILRTFRNNTT
ncbi:uncharacterized protein LOC102808684 [Saccoglossus kowalevskii]|uniref:Uncharacterized protein LOC102808684 n=1 Tax=Saccoglossus kowalevskii TaxID=10224 RepID=A0ABM0LUI0_SACKO|nr:PREDICTED: uncharacterized protein LOC102808684 [Saccoglossus kowalevskii]